jgi:histone demethylase JARID1
LWYGIPSKFARQFENVVRKYLPDLIKVHPNLFHLLITQISPKILRDEGITVYTATQSQGQFISMLHLLLVCYTLLLVC